MYQLDDLLYLMSRLRDPKHGCPWDLKQTFASILPHTLEEAYEVADAIEKQDYAHLKEELGEANYKVLKEIDSIQDGISVTPKLKKVNDTIYKMVQIISFSDSINQSEANENFKFLVRTGLHESAYNLLYERYEYYDIDWNQEELTTVLKSDSSRGNVWPIIEDDTK